MSNPKKGAPAPQKLVERSGYKAPSPSNAEKAARESGAYQGSALAKQEPEKKLTRPQQLEAASNTVVKAIEDVAALLTGTPPLALVQATYYHVDKTWAKPIKQLRDSLNASIKEYMRGHVEEVDGKEEPAPLEELTLDYGGSTYRAEKESRKFKMGNAKDMADVKSLAATLGVDFKELCHEVISYEYDEAATKAVIKTKLPKANADELIEEHRVTQSESLSIEKV
jgi:hypothetical protein